MHSALVGLAVAVPFAFGAAATPSGAHGTTVLRFQDPAVVEASALVVTDGLFVTTNDSGDSGRVFAVDRAGDTVGVTHWSASPTDCEALAPGGPGHVWVGDLGDNLARRSSISITRVPVGRGDRTVQATSYPLTYPHGATDAETLVRNPITGRLYVATKGLLGGSLYAVPRHLTTTRANELTRVGSVLPVATDGAFFPDGRHLVVRNYSAAEVYAWPSLRKVGSFDLPSERQGEGIAVAADGSVYLSSEGLHAPVLEVRLPAALRRATAQEPGDPTSGPSASSGPSTGPSTGPTSDPASDPATATDASSGDTWPWLAGGALALVAIVLLLRALRPR